jgi:hypothetical protein
LHAEDDDELKKCELKIDSSTQKEVPQGHLWIWYGIGVLLYCLWLIVVQLIQSYTERQVSRSKAFAISNCCVMLSNLNGTKGDNAKLESYARQFGGVRMAFHVRTLGRVVNICRQERFPTALPLIGAS